MKSESIQILKIILNITFIFSILICIALIATSIYLGFIGSLDYPMDQISFLFPIDSNVAAITMLIYSIFLYGFIIYIVYLLKRVVNSLDQGLLFTRFQIAALNLIGQLIIWATVLKAMTEFILKAIFNSKIQLTISFSDFWLYIALGAFFIVLAKVFERAKLLKEENELTV